MNVSPAKLTRGQWQALTMFNLMIAFWNATAISLILMWIGSP